MAEPSMPKLSVLISRVSVEGLKLVIYRYFDLECSWRVNFSDWIIARSLWFIAPTLFVRGVINGLESVCHSWFQGSDFLGLV